MATITQTRSYQGNAEAIEAWNGVLYDKFCRFRHIVTAGLGEIGSAGLARHPPPAGARVVDVGCGFGDSTRQIAGLVGAAGEAVGIDAAARFIETAGREAAEAGLANVRFRVADAQTDELGGPYDYAFSRFGTMFFLSPVAAFRNLRRSLRPGSPFVMTVWRRKDDNPWLKAAEDAVLAIVPLPESTDEPTCGPGPFSLASADLVSAQLLAAGFRDVCLERFDRPLRIGDSVADAVDFAMALGPAGEILRLAGEEGRRREAEVVAALERVLAPCLRGDGVFADASTWIVSARAA
jgi:ubiquinone/menaquinone biosynthesis C-methylase UbiE